MKIWALSNTSHIEEHDCFCSPEWVRKMLKDGFEASAMIFQTSSSAYNV